MENKEEHEETAPPRNEWEVVSLTQSAYAAAPGPRQVDLADDSNAKYVAETSDPMFMSGHFGFPQNQHVNSAVQPGNDEVLNEQGGEDATPELVADKGVNSDTYEESTKTKGLSTTEFHAENSALQPDNDEVLNKRGGEDTTTEFVADKGVNSDTCEISTKTKGLSTMEFPGDQIFDEKINILSLSGAEFEEDAALQGASLVDKEQNFFGSATYSSFHSEGPMGVSASTEENNMVAEPVEEDSGISNLPKAKDEDNDDAVNLPCQAWWKRRAVSLIAHAKDANAFWSIFVAAAVMGIVIIGQRWQLERWQVLEMNWKFGGHDERMSRAFISPISRLKEVMIGSGRPGSFIRGSASAQR
ncbi:ATG8-interacting protein 1-like [Lycium barbarum]|uniref:ATG8-interacting protein 1-like n=1 Tax=Lycium barbarum TaxID=112863 RepID=UPI00293F7243|nr:ATG8-interacting protein 1-like [Lycium barbarum]